MDYLQEFANVIVLLAFLVTGLFMTFVMPFLFYRDMMKRSSAVIEHGDSVIRYVVVTLVGFTMILFVMVDCLGWTITEVEKIAMGWTYAVVFLVWGMIVTLVGGHIYLVVTAIRRYGWYARISTAVASMLVLLISLYYLGMRTWDDSFFFLNSLSEGRLFFPGDIFRVLILNYDMHDVYHDGLIMWLVLTFCMTHAITLPEETKELLGFKKRKQ